MNEPAPLFVTIFVILIVLYGLYIIITGLIIVPITNKYKSRMRIPKNKIDPVFKLLLNNNTKEDD